VTDALGGDRCFDNDDNRGEEDAFDLTIDLIVPELFSRFFILWMSLSSLSGTSGFTSWEEATIMRLERFP